jgi:hypothetical protein
LHPDGHDAADSGWPRVLNGFAAEARRRADAGELACMLATSSGAACLTGCSCICRKKPSAASNSRQPILSARSEIPLARNGGREEMRGIVERIIREEKRR